MRTFLQAEASVFMIIGDGKRERALSVCQLELWKTGLQRRPGRCEQRQPASQARSRGNSGNYWMSTSPGWQWPSHCFLPKVLQVSYFVCGVDSTVKHKKQPCQLWTRCAAGKPMGWLSWTSGLGSKLCYQPATELGQIMWTKQSQSPLSVQHSRDL